MNLDTFVKSPLVNVHFAGFRSNTLELQNNGWQLSASEDFSRRSGYRELQLILHHSGGGMTMASRVQLMDVDFIMRRAPLPDFKVNAIQLSGRSTFMATPEPMDISFSSRSFVSIDATPSFERIDLSQIDLMKFGVFKKINDSANIFLPEKTIEELMSEILSKQDPRQKEIRQNNKRRDFMQDFNRNPNEEIKVQLIAI